jgi:DNA-binding PadR family transcriptional regulator
MDANVKRDILRKTILEQLTKGNIHYTDLDKKVCASSYPFATTNTFKSQLHYLQSNGYIKRIARGIYQITPKGKKCWDLLNF